MTHLFDTIERYPVNIVRGSRTAELFAEDGTRYLDFWSDESTTALGTDVSALLREFADSGIPHQLPDILPSPVREECATRLCATYGFDRVFFGNGGADSIETAIKLARKWAWAQGKQGAVCVTLEGNFHGRSYGALGLSDSVGSGSPYHKLGYDAFAPNATQWEGYGVAHPDMEDIGKLDADWVAAIFMAPILGNNCVRAYAPEFYKQLRDWCTRNNVLLVFDEIQTGSGWTGHYSAAQLFGVHPDIMVLGKRIALGFPMSACLADEDLAMLMTPGTHFNTFAGSPFVCWMANRWLDRLALGGLAAIREKGNVIAGQLRELRGAPVVNQYGMMISFQLDWDALGYDGRALCDKALEHGLIIVTHRPKGEIRFTPPISVPYDEIGEAFGILEHCQDELEL